MKNFQISNPTILKTFVIIAPGLLFLMALITGKALFWGTPAMQFIPWKYLAFESLKQGNMPLWNPFNGMGAPLLANYQLAFFYPPNWLSYLLAAFGGVSWLAWGETLIMALHLSWAAAGMIAFQKKMKVNLTGQLVSGLAFGMCGYLVARVGFFSIVIASTWLPWVMLAGTGLTDQILMRLGEWRRLFRTFLFLWFCISMQLLTGHAQITYYTLILAASWVALRSIRNAGWRGLVQNIVVFCGSAFLAVLTTAVQLLPTLEYLLDSQRSANVDYSIAMVYSFWPWRFLTLLFPNFFGNPGLGNYWGYANFWEDAVYIGILPLIAAIGTLFNLPTKEEQKNWDDKSTSKVFFWVVILIGFVLALGWNTPIFPFLYKHVPTFDMFNGPSRFLIWVEFALAALAGMGIEVWKKPGGRALRWTRLAIAGSAAVSIGAGLSQFYLKGVNVTFIPAAAIAGGLGAFTALLVLLIPLEGNEKGIRLWKAAVVLLVAFDLFLADWNLNPFIDARFYQRATASEPLLAFNETRRVFLPEESEYRMKFDRFFTFNSHFSTEEWEQLWAANIPDANLITGTQMLNNFDPLLPSRFVKLNNYFATLNQDDLIKMLENLSVTEIETATKSNPEEIKFTAVNGKDRYRMYPCAVSAANSEEAWTQVTGRVENQAEDLFDPVIIEGIEIIEANACLNIDNGTVHLISHQPAKIVLEVNSEGGAWLEIAETWYPGWTAEIDNKQVDIYPSNYIFKAVKVPAGRHTIVLAYRPVSFIAGAVITMISLVFVAIVLYLSGLKNHNKYTSYSSSGENNGFVRY
ncbi:MAG: YfhO family protein [Anaerolineaceae bacterium]